MSAPIQVANSFAAEFFERLAKNPIDIAEFYGHHASVTVNDFELGTTEAVDEEIPATVANWASILHGSQLRVETINAAPLYSGVNVFITFTTVGRELQQYFQITTTLESYASGFAVEGYYIRHQIISRIGAIAIEPPRAPTPAAVEEPTLSSSAAAAAAEVTAGQDATHTAATQESSREPSFDAAGERRASVEAAAVSSHAAPPACSEAEAAEREHTEATAAAAATAAKPVTGSWAKLASAAPVRSAPAHKMIRVVAREIPAKKEEHREEKSDEKENENAASRAAAGPAKEFVRRERKPAEPVGDRLMFNIDVTVTDDEIKAALGPVVSSLVSLRNNSERGHVFMDFAQNVKALEAIKKTNPTIGATKTRVNVFRQRARD